MTKVPTTMRTAYLAGPMRGYEEYNFPLFRRAAKWLRKDGWKIESPHERDEAEGFDPKNDEAHSLDYYMQFDLAMVSRTDAVICLPLWEESQGARLETMVAVELGHPVFEITGPGGTAPERRKTRDWQLTAVAPEYVIATFADKSMRIFEGDTVTEAVIAAGESGIKLPSGDWPFPPSAADLAAWTPTEEQEKVIEEGLANGTMRVFEGGATRNVVVDPDYHGFFSPLAMHAYGEYMHAHRVQADGSLRDPDNWQKGDAAFEASYLSSLRRHVQDIELIEDGYENLARQDDRDPDALKAHLSAVIFNAQMKLHFLVKKEQVRAFIDSEVDRVRAAIFGFDASEKTWVPDEVALED